jgi:hypothetical protein
MAPAAHERKDDIPTDGFPTSFPTTMAVSAVTVTTLPGNSVVLSVYGHTITVPNTNTTPQPTSNQPPPTSTSTDYQHGPAQSSTYSDTSSEGPYPGAPTSTGQSSLLNNPQAEHHGHAPFPAIVAVGIIIPLILISLSVLGCFYCIRLRRRQHRQNIGNAGPQMTNMSGVRGGMGLTERAYFGPVTTPPAAVLSPHTPTSPASSGPPPVILSTTMNNTYYTGIDTSDHISLTDQRSHTSAESITGDEPPPPYRPASVPPISRETSLRATASNRNDPLSGAGLIPRSEEVRSPFDDPESSDDDALSQISTIRSYPRRPTDRRSVASDMSYQDEEHVQAAHSHV